MGARVCRRGIIQARERGGPPRCPPFPSSSRRPATLAAPLPRVGRSPAAARACAALTSACAASPGAGRPVRRRSARCRPPRPASSPRRRRGAMRSVRSSRPSSSPVLSVAVPLAGPRLAHQPGVRRRAVQVRPLLPHQIQCHELVPLCRLPLAHCPGVASETSPLNCLY